MNTIIRNRFPVFAATALAALIFVGFSRTYYLRFLSDVPPLTVAAHLHGLFATLWLVLHYTQARLIAVHRVDLHKRLGIVTVCVGVLVAVQALNLAIGRVAEGHAPAGRDPLQFLSVPIGTTTMFSAFLLAGVLLRRKRDWHKRFMFLATLALIVPAVARLDALIMLPLGLPRNMLAVPMTVAFVAWAWWDDWRKLKRIHPAYIVGGLALIASVPLRRAIGFTDWWRPIAEWIVS